MNEQANIETINYRLSAIETTLKDVKDLLVETKLQRNEIDLLKQEFREMKEIFEDHVSSANERLNEVETLPLKNHANKFETITNTFFKIIITGIAIYFCTKIGIPT